MSVHPLSSLSPPFPRYSVGLHTGGSPLSHAGALMAWESEHQASGCLVELQPRHQCEACGCSTARLACFLLLKFSRSVHLCPFGSVLQEKKGGKSACLTLILCTDSPRLKRLSYCFWQKIGGQGGEKEAIRNKVLRVPLKVSLKLQKFSPRSVTQPLLRSCYNRWPLCTNEHQEEESPNPCHVTWHQAPLPQFHKCCQQLG